MEIPVPLVELIIPRILLTVLDSAFPLVDCPPRVLRWRFPFPWNLERLERSFLVRMDDGLEGFLGPLPKVIGGEDVIHQSVVKKGS